MHTCRNCGRQFKKQNQGHFCSEKPETIDAYIAQQDEAVQADLRLVR